MTGLEKRVILCLSFSLSFIITTAIRTAPGGYKQTPTVKVEKVILTPTEKDCGITIKEGVTGGKLSGFTIKGHDYGICLDNQVSNVEINPTTSNVQIKNSQLNNLETRNSWSGSTTVTNPNWSVGGWSCSAEWNSSLNMYQHHCK